MVRLVISDNEGTTTVVPLVRDEITIGRKEGNTIRLTERNISRRHAQLAREGGIYKLRDLDSYNGVTINGRRVQGESAINTGDQIQIGDYTLIVEEEATAAKSIPPDEPTTVSRRPVTPARFVMLGEPSAGAEFALPADRAVRLGRSEEVDCPINHRSVSREHAEVMCDAGVYFISDLGSANGITVNGNQVKRHRLQSGDILELGQVVFRYVDPGEHYFFDAAEAARHRSTYSRGKPNNLRIAAAVIAAAVVVAIVIVMSSGGDDKHAAAAGGESSATGHDPAAIADDGYDKDVSACRAAIGGARFAEAIAHAALALKVRPSAPDATACRNDAQAQYEDEQCYVRGKAALQAGDGETALREFSRLGAGSAFRARPEVASATQQVAMTRLSKARSLLDAGNAAEAARIAQGVLMLAALPADLSATAQALLAETHKPAPETAVAAAHPTTKSAPQRTAAAAAAPKPAPAPKPAATPKPSAQQPIGNAMDLASACLARGDNECVIRALAGKANTAQELGLLIETYRAIGDAKAAQKNMATYVKRFPTARRADAYRHMLELQSN